MITTTLNRIRAHDPCEPGWRKLLRGLNKTTADDEPLPYATILRINGIDDAAWCCRAEPQHAHKWRLFLVRCAMRLYHRSVNRDLINGVAVADLYAHGAATNSQLEHARQKVWVALEAANKRYLLADEDRTDLVAERNLSEGIYLLLEDEVSDAAFSSIYAFREVEGYGDPLAAAAERVAQSALFLEIVGEEP